MEGDAHEGVGKPKSFVIVYNVAKRHNIGTLARSASAFGVSELILVGNKDFNVFGSHGSSLHLQFRHFSTLSEARIYAKNRGCDICGVEILDGAKPIHEHPFRRSTFFLLGNEGTGLSEKEKAICDYFVYIPQYGCGTSSLNVTVAASIVLQHFAVWADFPERQREGQKFIVSEHPLRQGWRNICIDSPEAIAEMRLQKKKVLAQEWLDGDLTKFETNYHEGSVAEKETSASGGGSSLPLLSN